jgi:hypothetical protein
VVLWHDREKRGPPRVSLAPRRPRLLASVSAAVNGARTHQPVARHYPPHHEPGERTKA